MLHVGGMDGYFLELHISYSDFPDTQLEDLRQPDRVGWQRSVQDFVPFGIMFVFIIYISLTNHQILYKKSFFQIESSIMWNIE